MAENPNWAARPGAGAVAIDEGLRSYMLGVYNYMATGLGITGLVAYLGYASGLYAAIAATPLIWVVMFAPLILVFVMSARLHKMNVGTAQGTFWAFAALMGLSLSSIFFVYQMSGIARTFFVTAASFGALSIWGYTTKRDLSGFGQFLFIGLIGIIIAMLVNLFLRSPGLDFAVSAIGVLIFAGLTAFDTQRIKEMYVAGDDVAVMGRKSILGALRLYLDFINLFLFLLRFLGGNRS